MRSLAFRPLITLCAAVAFLGCDRSPDPGATAVTQQALISDQAHSGGQFGFYFLPPMVKQAMPAGTFDGSQSPIVRIDEIDPAAPGTSRTIATYSTTSGPGSDRVHVERGDDGDSATHGSTNTQSTGTKTSEQDSESEKEGDDSSAPAYIVNWHTNDFALSTTKIYRVNVLLGSKVLGFADVKKAASEAQLKTIDTTQYVPLLNGTLPIKWFINQCGSVFCSAQDQCHVAGMCDLATARCSNPPAVDGTACNDGTACTRADACVAGVCTGSNPVVCSAQDQCHVAGTCNPSTGVCSNPAASDGTACSDGSACTQTDACSAGVCTGNNPVVCSAQDQCHAAGACDPATGACSNPAVADGTACNDGNACTQTDTCVAGKCSFASAIACPPADQCHAAGICDPATGSCSSVPTPDGACSNGACPAWVEIGAKNQAIARVLTPCNICPSITVDGVTSPMSVRVLAGSEPLRPTSTDATLAQAQTSGNSKPSVFTTTTCEFNLPANASSAIVAGTKLPLPKPVVDRVVILGDTGCRVSIGNVYQNCTEPTIWPFSVISAAAAAMKPDLVLHVGDYQYRDNPCPPGNTACAGTPWGYGSDTWMADLFTPAAPLLAAAPWVMVRGNHETCNRAGQGWYRYLDPNPYDATDVKTCNDSTKDTTGNYNDPWAVSFGDTQFIVFDSANASKSAYSPAAFQPYTSELAAAAMLATPSLLNIWAVHHPVLGYSAANPPTSGNPGLQSVMNAAYPMNYYPPNIGLAVHGHVHDFQALNFSSNHPATFVAGNGGDNLDSALPVNGAGFNPNSDLPAGNTAVSAFAFSQEFGFMVMDRVGNVGDRNWSFTSFRTDGSIIAVCDLAPPLSSCSGACDSTPGNQISCTDASGSPIGLGTTIGVYDNIP